MSDASVEVGWMKGEECFLYKGGDSGKRKEMTVLRRVAQTGQKVENRALRNTARGCIQRRHVLLGRIAVHRIGLRRCGLVYVVSRSIGRSVTVVSPIVVTFELFELYELYY